MQKLVHGIHQFQAHIFRARYELFERLTSGQDPQALFITCSDSRVMPDLITQAEPGDLFVLRNAGNLVPPHGAAPDSGEAATIEYAVTALKIRDVIVCGHTLCGAMQALLQPEVLTNLPRMRQWLAHAESTREIVTANYREIPADGRWKAAVEENVLVQLENLRTHPCVAAGLARGTLKLHGWVYKLETGQVFAYDPAQGQFLPLGPEVT
ncbi:MAG: carbonic anhydrase, partial [Zavarzinella sp.]|nr:carbonic anhydrase [Zavarzinella sp.]